MSIWSFSSPRLSLVRCIGRVLLAAAGVWCMLALPALADSPPSDPPYSRPGVGLDTDEPIWLNSGAYEYAHPLLSIPGPLPLRVSLDYRSDNYPWLAFGAPRPNGAASHFQHSFLPSMEKPNASMVAIETMKAGELARFDKRAGVWTLLEPSPTRYTLQETAGYFYLQDPLEERLTIFQKQGSSMWMRIVAYLDRRGNGWYYTYSGASVIPTRVEDGLGRSLQVTANAGSPDYTRPITRLTDGCGRVVSLTVSSNLYTAATDPLGKTTTFSYQNGYLTAVRRPAGNTPYTQGYASRKLNGVTETRVVTQTDAYGNRLALTYHPTSNVVTLTLPTGATQIYEHFGNDGPPKSLTDQAGKKASFTQTAQGQTGGTTDRMGATAGMTYHAQSGKLAAAVNALGQTTVFTYTPQTQVFTNPLLAAERVTVTFYNLTAIGYPNGTTEQFAHDARGNVLSWTDRAGAVWTYTYDGRGQLLTETNPTGGVIGYTYNLDETVATQSAGASTTHYQYDACKRLAQITYPDGASESFSYDAGDRLLQRTDAGGTTHTFEYDANGNLTRAVQAANTALAQTQSYAYDLVDRLTTSTDAAGGVTQIGYTFWNGVAQVTLPDGAVTTIQHDPRQRVSGMVDPAGRVWQVQRDDEAIPTQVTTPDGRQVTLQSDATGLMTEVIDPLGRGVRLERDAVGQVIGITDWLSREVRLARDGVGRVVSITLPVIGAVAYARDGLGNVTEMEDPRGSAWRFGYTPLGRLSWRRDPLGNEWQYAYDARGRLRQTTRPDGSVETLTYDASGNLSGRSFSDGLSLTYSYDALGRLTGAGDAPIAFSYDARGLITDTQMSGAHFGATYDARRRLTTVGYDGRMTVSYAYDARGLVSQVSDSATGAWVKFTYDADGLLTRMERSNGIPTDFTRDGDGRITRIKHGDLADMQFDFNDAGQITQIIEKLPLDVAAFLRSELAQYLYDAANQIMSAGYAYDALGRRIRDPKRQYVWDSAGRLASVTQGADAVAYVYTALGDLARRTANGVSTDYFYNYAIDGHPIMAEKRAGGYTRFYVYTPAGQLLYSVDQPTSRAAFYHFNHLGTTLFLTDAAGGVTDSYGYAPYGEMIKHYGPSDQPFTYVGEQGVRQESAAGLYHMRARYYDARAGAFLSRDPAWPWVGNPKASNPYQYAGQNPLSFIDPSGLDYTQVNGMKLANNGARPAAFDYAGVNAYGSSSWSIYGSRQGQATTQALGNRQVPRRKPPRDDPADEEDDADYGEDWRYTGGGFGFPYGACSGLGGCDPMSALSMGGCNPFGGMGGAAGCDPLGGMGGLPGCNPLGGMGGMAGCDPFGGLGGVAGCDPFGAAAGLAGCAGGGVGNLPGVGGCGGGGAGGSGGGDGIKGGTTAAYCNVIAWLDEHPLAAAWLQARGLLDDAMRLHTMGDVRAFLRRLPGFTYSMLNAAVEPGTTTSRMLARFMASVLILALCVWATLRLALRLRVGRR
jgi:RHS repeat-associated protein